MIRDEEEAKFTFRDLEKETGVSKATINRYLKDYRIKPSSPLKRRGKRAPRRLFTETELKKVQLAIALKEDVLFLTSEIRDVVNKMDPDTFMKLYHTEPWPKLIKTLKHSNVKIIAESVAMKKLLDRTRNR